MLPPHDESGGDHREQKQGSREKSVKIRTAEPIGQESARRMEIAAVEPWNAIMPPERQTTAMQSPTTPFDELGGEPRLRAIIDRFIDRVFEDIMIGFFFRHADKQRVKEKEYELAARQLGAPIAYTGRPIREAHASHPIMGGQFMRRLRILEETLDEYQVPQHVKERWLAHTEKLRDQVTRDSGGRCDPVAALDKTRGSA